MRKTRALAVLMALGLMGCSELGQLPREDGVAALADGGVDARWSVPCSDEAADADGDGIPNGVEGCKSERNSDDDAIADWRDPDSDNDGIPDRIEAGTPGACRGPKPGTWPCDSDGDGIADYLDLDSDGDGVDDRDEDLNGDGQLGCCIGRCGEATASQRASCQLDADGCGPSQRCEGGVCMPALAFACSEGETSPLLEDSFGDGVSDRERGSFICRDATESDPRGRKRIRLIKSALAPSDPGSGDWHLALDASARYGELVLDAPAAGEVLAALDHDQSAIEVAGFAISLPEPIEAIGPFVDELVGRIQQRVAALGGTVAMRSTGTVTKSHDKFDMVEGTHLQLALPAAQDVSTLRNELAAALMGRVPASIQTLPAPFGAASKAFVLRFSTVRRFAFARDAAGVLRTDAAGFPLEDSSASDQRRVLLIGAVAGEQAYGDPSRATGVVVDDLAGGSQLATYRDTVSNECDVGQKAQTAKADIVWVIDESQSVTELTAAIRDNIERGAADFYRLAQAAGLDFRMGVTGIVSPESKHNAVRGKFCSEALSDPDASGGDPALVDRFLLPNEAALFGACIKNPYGREGGAEYGLHTAQRAIERHLDPSAVAPGGLLRDDAKRVVIIATDEPSKTVIDLTSIPATTKSCQFGPNLAQDVLDAVSPFVSFFKAEAVEVHLIGFVCSSLKACAPADQTGRGVAHGYVETVRALGGVIGDVCQSDLSGTLQAIVDSIVGAASPLRLQRVPIATSLAVAVGGQELARSRERGFDYNAAKNTIAFYGGVAQPGQDVVVSYRRWERQVTIK